MKLSFELKVAATISIIALVSTSPLSYTAERVLLITRIRLSNLLLYCENISNQTKQVPDQLSFILMRLHDADIFN